MIYILPQLVRPFFFKELILYCSKFYFCDLVRYSWICSIKWSVHKTKNISCSVRYINWPSLLASTNIKIQFQSNLYIHLVLDQFYTVHSLYRLVWEYIPYLTKYSNNFFIHVHGTRFSNWQYHIKRQNSLLQISRTNVFFSIHTMLFYYRSFISVNCRRMWRK